MIGAHVSAAGSVALCFERAQKISADCFQTFISPPQQWLMPEYQPDVIAQFRQQAEETKIGPNFIHGTYLINLGTANPEHLLKSVNWLAYALKTADQLGMQGVIFHLGSHKGLGFEAVAPQVIESIQSIIQQAGEGKSQLILETSAGAGGNIGGKFGELGILLKGAGHERVKVCLDTAHVYSAGYDIKNNINQVMDDFEMEIGLKNLVVCHANDSKGDFSSGKDRHENIGAGSIGTEGFYAVTHHPIFQEIPLILEVPGFENNGPDQQNIDILRSVSETT